MHRLQRLHGVQTHAAGHAGIARPMSRPTRTFNFAVLHPDLAAEWHPSRNAGPGPESYSPKSNQKVWWQCRENPKHEWTAVIGKRHAAGCPFCRNSAHQKHWISDGNGERRQEVLADRQRLFSELVAQGARRLECGALYVGSSQLLTWKCLDCDHVWQRMLRKRAIDSEGCAYCTRSTAQSNTSLLALHPEIATQWDVEANARDPKIAKGPARVPASLHHSAMWRCQHGHAWRMHIGQRVQLGVECPICRPTPGRLELRLVSEIETALGLDVVCGKPLQEWVCDILIPELKVVVEVEEFPWHLPLRFADALDLDRQKSAHLQACGYRLIRVRDMRLPPVHGGLTLSYAHGAEDLAVCKALLRALADGPRVGKALRTRAAQYQLRDAYLDTSAYASRLAESRLPALGESLAEKFPGLAAQWCYEENLPLTPESTRADADRRVIWQCASGHQWPESIQRRSDYDAGCRACAGLRAGSGKQLAASYPELAAEWDDQRNGSQCPEDVELTSAESYWWRCALGHAWRASVKGRIRGAQHCPYCARELPSAEWNLALALPGLAAWFDTEKNGRGPQTVLPQEDRNYWWKCPQGHAWKATAKAQSGPGPVCLQCQPRPISQA